LSDVLFKAITGVVEALEPFTPVTANINRMWYGSRGFFQLSPLGGAASRTHTPHFTI
jgi:hypothetical protein